MDFTILSWGHVDCPGRGQKRSPDMVQTGQFQQRLFAPSLSTRWPMFGRQVLARHPLRPFNTVPTLLCWKVEAMHGGSPRTGATTPVAERQRDSSVNNR
jgi:hypothetical protein